MKVQLATADVERSSDFEEEAFGFDVDNPEAFQILSDTLYTDKIKAVIREPSCNAYDSMVAAGKADVPFEVHLPNSLEPFFSVKDTGVGLDHMGVMKVYKTYFKSLKTHSNDFIGGFGLGSKSPFAYVDTFTITARFDGKERIYTAFKNENGIPALALLSEQDTEECNGVEVSFAVNPSDFHYFHSKAREVLSRFDPLPVVKGAANFLFNVPDYVLKGQGWGIMRQGHAVAIMGNVAYPLKGGINGLSPEQDAIINLPIEIEFKVGSLKPAASREALSMTKKTQETIKARLEEIYNELPTKFNQEFAACKTLWEAARKYEEVFSYNSTTGYALQNLARSGKLEIKWNGKKLKSSKVRVHMDAFEGLRILEWYDGGYYGSRKGREVRTESYMNQNKETVSYIDFDTSKTDIVFVVDDLEKKGATTRTATYFKARNATGSPHVFLLLSENKELFDKFIDEAGNPPKVIKASTLPKPERRSYVRDDGTMIGYQWVKRSRYPERGRKWEETELNVDAGGFYIPLKGFEIQHQGGALKQDFYDLVELVKDCGLLKDFTAYTPIYGVRSTCKDALEDNPDWINFLDHVTEKVAERVAKGNLSQQLADAEHMERYNQQRRVSDRLICKLSGNMKLLDALDESSPFRQFATAYVEVDRSARGGAEKLKQLALKFGAKVEASKPKHDLVALWNAMNSRYGMLRYIHNSYDYVDEAGMKAVIEYVKMIDDKLSS